MVADLEELYASLSPRLESIVRMDVRAPGSVIEEACQLAWGRLVRHRDRVEQDSALSWLTKTAIHEALRLLGRQRRWDSLEATIELHGDGVLPRVAPGADEVFEMRTRLDEIAALPHRQQQMMWLHGLGYDYREIADATACTVRTVERQLLRAKRTMRERATE